MLHHWLSWFPPVLLKGQDGAFSGQSTEMSCLEALSAWLLGILPSYHVLAKFCKQTPPSASLWQGAQVGDGPPVDTRLFKPELWSLELKGHWATGLLLKSFILPSAVSLLVGCCGSGLPGAEPRKRVPLVLAVCFSAEALRVRLRHPLPAPVLRACKLVRQQEDRLDTS